MATIRIHGHTDANISSTAYIGTNSAVGFGYNSSAWPNNVLLNATARFMTLVSGPTAGATKSSMFNCMSYGDAVSNYKYTTAGAAGTVQDTAAIAGYSSASPTNRYQCLNIHFAHDNAVDANPVYCWVSSGSGGTVGYTFCNSWICEVTASGHQDWTESTPTNKMSLMTILATATSHDWYVGVSVTPVSSLAGFSDDMYMQVSVTYS